MLSRKILQFRAYFKTAFLQQRGGERGREEDTKRMRTKDSTTNTIGLQAQLKQYTWCAKRETEREEVVGTNCTSGRSETIIFSLWMEKSRENC